MEAQSEDGMVTASQVQGATATSHFSWRVSVVISRQLCYLLTTAASIATVHLHSYRQR